MSPKDAKGNPQYLDVDYVDTWKGMEDCVNAGLTHSIGLSNFNSEQINRILEAAQIKPTVNQVPFFISLNFVSLYACLLECPHFCSLNNRCNYL